MPVSLPAHVWLSEADRDVPALLLAWRREGDGWVGQVVKPAGGDVVVVWVPADRVRLAGATTLNTSLNL